MCTHGHLNPVVMEVMQVGNSSSLLSLLAMLGSQWPYFSASASLSF